MIPTIRTLRAAQGVVAALMAALLVQGWPTAGTLILLALLGLGLERLQRRVRRLRWEDALRRAQGLVDAEAPPSEVREACEQAFELAPEGSVERLLTRLELDRCLVLEGDVSRRLETRLRGQVETARELWGEEDVNFGVAAQSLGLFYWRRARICLEQDGVVQFHDTELLRRVGENMLGYFYEGEGGPDELDEADLDPTETQASRLAAITFHWKDLYDAEDALHEALGAFRVSVGEDDLRTALSKAVLAQVMGVNRSPDMALELAGESVITIQGLEGEDSPSLAPAYEALGLAYHMMGKTAESNLYLRRSERLVGEDFKPEPVLPERPNLFPDVVADAGTTDYRVHVPEELDPVIN